MAPPSERPSVTYVSGINRYPCLRKDNWKLGVGSWELIGLLQRLNGRRALLNRRAAELRDGPADLHGCVKDLAHRDAPCEAMASDRFQACRGNAAAVAAIGIAAELTRHDAPLHVGGKAVGRLGEDAVLRRLRWLGVDVQHAVEHL